MKVPYSWIKAYVDIKMPAAKLAEHLTMAGMEVTSLCRYDDDFVFEIEITSNRQDCLSVTGIAREVSAITGAKRKPHDIMLKTKPLPLPLILHPFFNISIADNKTCPLYIARIIKDVRISPSPAWLVKRLNACGISSINNIVDITNYVCLELGQPLHAFDYEKIKGSQIAVRYAMKGERLTTIDNVERVLESSDLIIADASKPLAIAGVMGGYNSKVVDETKDILLESAYFDPLVVRRASRRLKLSSESSYRFERGVAADMVEAASKRAASIILQLAGGRLINFACRGSLHKERKKTIILSRSKIHKILGADVPITTTKRILKRLGFAPLSRTSSGKALKVSIPSFRRDIKAEADLIEEIARIYGYSKIPAKLPALSFNFIPESKLQIVSRAISQTLTGLGINEAITYSVLASNSLTDIFRCNNSEMLKLSNPLSLEQDTLRPYIFPGLVLAISYNLNRDVEKPGLFELGKVFRSTLSGAKEKPHLSIATSAGDFFYIKGAIEALFCVLGISGYSFEKIEKPYLTNGACAGINAQGEHIGFLGQLSKDIIKALDISKDVYLCELCLDGIVKCAALERYFIKLPKYPAQVRDISIEVDDGIPYTQIISVIKEAGAPLAKEIRLFDYYKGAQIAEGKKSLAYSIEYRSNERTLTDEEVSEVHTRIHKRLIDELGARIR